MKMTPALVSVLCALGLLACSSNPNDDGGVPAVALVDDATLEPATKKEDEELKKYFLCLGGCLGKETDCLDRNAGVADRNQICEDVYLLCVEGCNRKYPLPKPPPPMEVDPLDPTLP